MYSDVKNHMCKFQNNRCINMEIIMISFYLIQMIWAHCAQIQYNQNIYKHNAKL